MTTASIIIYICFAIALCVVGFICLHEHSRTETKSRYLIATLICWLAAAACIVAAILITSENQKVDCTCKCECCQTCENCTTNST